jgi:hypothetical protein
MTLLGASKPKGVNLMSPMTETPKSQTQAQTGSLPYDAIFEQIKAGLMRQFPVEIKYRKPVFEHTPNRNRMRIYLDGIAGSHYEICFRQAYFEFALHFESTPARSLARRQAFDPHREKLTKQVGVLVKTGPVENKGWMRVWFEQKREPITDSQKIELYTDLFSRFIIATSPILIEAYEKGM